MDQLWERPDSEMLRPTPPSASVPLPSCCGGVLITDMLSDEGRLICGDYTDPVIRWLGADRYLTPTFGDEDRAAFACRTSAMA